MYTTFSVVESIPPLTSRRRRPVSFSSPQSSPFRSVRQSSRLVKPCSREAPQFTHAYVYAYVQFTHAQFTAHEEHPSSQPASQPSALPFHGFRSVPISDDRWDTCTALRTTHTRESLIRFSDHQVFLHERPWPLIYHPQIIRLCLNSLGSQDSLSKFYR